MSKQDEIAYLVGELDKAKQELVELQSDPTSPAWKITRLTRSITDYEAELQQLRQADAGGSSHNQTISGNARVGVAISGNNNGSITQQSGGVRYEGGSTHTGDNVAGDKFSGDKVMGDNVAGDKVAGDKVSGNKTTGNTTTFGDISNSVINIDSLLDGVEQSINRSPHLDAASKTELQELFKQLAAELQQPTTQQSSDTKEIVNSAKDAAEAVSKEQLDKPKLTVSLDGLKKAALDLGKVLPNLILPAFKIADILSKLV